MLSRFHKKTSKRGAAILEYVIIAVGIAIFCTFGILMFGKSAQHQMDQATGVLSGKVSATDTSSTAQAITTAGSSSADATARTGTGMDRR